MNAKKKLLITAWMLVVSCFISTTHADIIDNDHYTTVSGLDWLDWSTTRGLTQGEALSIYGQESGWGNQWRIATHDETISMLAELNASVDGRELDWESGGSMPIYDDFDFLFTAIDLLGQTTNPESHYSDRSRVIIEGLGYYGVMEEVALAGWQKDTAGAVGYSNENTGIALVRVPAPATNFLLMLGVCAIVLCRLKTQRNA